MTYDRKKHSEYMSVPEFDEAKKNLEWHDVENLIQDWPISSHLLKKAVRKSSVLFAKKGFSWFFLINSPMFVFNSINIW